MDDLKNTSKKTFGRNLNTDIQKYFYYDSDDDRIDISDDEDLESAINQCKKTCLKIHIENYDFKTDPFFKKIPSFGSEKHTRPSSEKSKIPTKIGQLVSSGKSNYESLGSSADMKESK